MGHKNLAGDLWQCGNRAGVSVDLRCTGFPQTGCINVHPCTHPIALAITLDRLLVGVDAQHMGGSPAFAGGSHDRENGRVRRKESVDPRGKLVARPTPAASKAEAGMVVEEIERLDKKGAGVMVGHGGVSVGPIPDRPPFPPPSLRADMLASGCAGEQRERRHVCGGRGAIKNGIRQAWYRACRDPRRFGERKQIDMVARVLLAAQKTDTLEIGEPMGCIFARTPASRTGRNQLLGGIALTAFVVTDLGDRPARNRLAVGQDEIDAR